MSAEPVDAERPIHPIRPIRALRRPWTVEILTADEIEQVHETSLRVLAEIGLEVRSPTVVADLAREGADVDEAAMRVRFPAPMVETALAVVPPTFTLAGRDPAYDLPIDGSAGYLSTDGTPSEIVDLETGMRRPTTLADLRDTTLLGDAVPEIGYLWPAVAPADVDPRMQSVEAARIMLANSTKHANHNECYSAFDARAVLEMGAAVVGGEDELRRRPVISTYQCAISPLMFDGGPIEAALEFARAGVPTGFVTMAVGMAAAPATLAGHLVSTNAELLGGITILETLVPGTPTYYGPYQAFMDLRSGGMNLAWGPEDVMLKLASAQLGRRYGLRINIQGFQTGAKTQDWQAGAQHGISLMTIAIAGSAELIAATGTIYGAGVWAHENVLLDAELFDIICRATEGFEVSEETLAFDAIREAGPGGHFLASPHTLRHMRDRWTAHLFGAETWEEWEAAGRPSARERAHERVKQILAEHQPEPLPDDVAAELDRLVERHRRTLADG
ncbi:MAG: trimethylamine methyltransferase family protein [Solirubrobacterales bacterium]